MNTTDRLNTMLLRAAAAIVTTIGIAHLFMPAWGYDPHDLVGMSEPAMEHFYYLGTYAIAGFLLSMGALTLVLSRHPAGADRAAMATIMTVFWGARLALEVAYPVSLPIFSVDNPHPGLLTVMAVLCLAYGAAAIRMWRA